MTTRAAVNFASPLTNPLAHPLKNPLTLPLKNPLILPPKNPFAVAALAAGLAGAVPMALAAGPGWAPPGGAAAPGALWRRRH